MVNLTKTNARNFLCRAGVVTQGRGHFWYYNKIDFQQWVYILQDVPVLGVIRRGKYAGCFMLRCDTRGGWDNAIARIKGHGGYFVNDWESKSGRSFWIVFTFGRGIKAWENKFKGGISEKIPEPTR